MMKMKTVLVSALSTLAVGTAALVNVQGVIADTPNIAKSDYDPSKVKYLKVQMSLSQDTSSGKLKITASIDTFPEGMNEVSIPFFLFNVKTQVTEKFPGLADAIFTPSQPSMTREYDMKQANLNAFADGEYRIVLRDWKQPPYGYYRYYGHSDIVTIQDHKIVGTGSHINHAKNGWYGKSYYKNGIKVRNEFVTDPKDRGVYYLDSYGNYIEGTWRGKSYFKPGGRLAQEEWIYDKNSGAWYYLTFQAQYVKNGWVGNYYLKSDGKMAQSEWIYDNRYKSYYYLTSNGSYARNTWIGNYYLKSDGKMAQSEWIYDKSYKSYYYLTSNGSYARNAWIGNYYLKPNGKMAKSEWIYDRNYGAYYYLTGEGSYARNTWVGDYYLKANGKMAVNGYRVDGSGKWIR